MTPYFQVVFLYIIGPDLTEFDIPENTYIQVPNNLDTLCALMEELPKLEVSNYLNSIYDFIMSNKIIDIFDGNKVYEKILLDIEAFVGKRNQV